jgi:hypothetical protein
MRWGGIACVSLLYRELLAVKDEGGAPSPPWGRSSILDRCGARDRPVAGNPAPRTYRGPDNGHHF